MRWLSLLVVAGLMVVGSGCGETKKTSSPSGDKELKVTGPSTTNIKQGEREEIKVKVTRKGFEDDVTLKFSDLPDGVKLEEADPKIPKGTNDVTLHLKAADKAPVKSDVVAKVTASSPALKEPVTVEFKVNVKEKK
jgi:hypothetical protein